MLVLGWWLGVLRQASVIISHQKFINFSVMMIFYAFQVKLVVMEGPHERDSDKSASGR